MVRGLRTFQDSFSIREIIGEMAYTKVMAKLHGYKVSKA